MDKNTLREEYINIRNSITNKDIKSVIIYNKLISDKDYINSKRIALYNSLDSEVSTKKLIDYSLDKGKTVLLPVVDNDNMEFYIINRNTKYNRSTFGILEPISKDNLNKALIDLIIVPGICFDLNKNRIGFGKGYYDKYLSNTSIKTIGICFDEQITNQDIDCNKYDVKVKRLISDKRSL
ncbi:MAG: 5-formyltetrahydrofolate cyclo-ligase [Bacilli bacterium]|nr:5-formyltetrahydrofolate cyclo-ligase [Bacilli bacterium]